MQADSRLILWLVGMLILGLGIVLGVIIAKRTRKKETHIRELEEQLTQSREELAQYRSQVDDYFFKTSELVEQMTASYRAVYLHLAEGAHALSGRDYETAHLTLAGGDLFDPLAADHEPEINSPPVSAEEELTSGIVGHGTEAAAPDNSTGEEGEEKTILAEKSEAETPDREEPDEQGEPEENEQGADDAEERDEK